uniref:Uncharacterized protein n=1 Tax=Arundo donax TaxID=35708 RepID=A0A0A9AB47_ARUDO
MTYGCFGWYWLV